MHDNFQKLIATLGEELRIVAELRALLEQEREPIKRFDAATLETITARKRTLQASLAQHERARRQTVGQLAAFYGLDPEKATLRDLAGYADERQRATLLKARDVFRQLSSEVGAKVVDNAVRVDRSLWLVRSLRRLMTNEIQEVATYEDLARQARRAPAAAKGK